MTIDGAVEKFLQNKYWANLYENAPERVKPFLRADFATSLLKKDDKEYKKAVSDYNNAKEKLTKADCKWLLKNDGKTPMARWYYKTMMDNAKE